MSTARLYAILDLGYVPEESAEKVTASLLAGGADMLQLRAKNHDLATIERVARRLLPVCRAAGVPFILNDHPGLAATLDADGVHIGQDDGSLAEARLAVESARGIQSAMGRGIHSGLHSFLHSSSSPRPFLFGRSTHSLDQARAALAEGFDYIGFGPLFPTPTKAGRPAIGLEEIAVMEQDVGKNIPAYCIGGITSETLDQVLAAGTRRAVVVSALLQAPDVEAATRHIKARLGAG
jgi:thiamine-phosphate pyrophosphorylase